MPDYKAPLDDMRFLLAAILPEDELRQVPAYAELEPDIIDAVLEQTGQFCETVLRPLNQIGDSEGCTLENGVVRTPSGFKDAYSDYTAAGLCSVNANPQYGGQGLPETIGVLLREMQCSANVAFSMYGGLSHGVYRALDLHGSDDQKNRYLPPLVDGSWTGTMCLTEPHCGTDLGLLRTKAEPTDDGAFKVTGTKIFISAGDHDLTENIIHLVLARTPDAPEGVRGISLFLVPKFVVNEDGSVGARNGVSCGSLENKMGIHGSATCVLNFDEASGFLVGKLNKGMQAMFTMMNAARLAVACQGVGLAQAAYQNAVEYAGERLQGRALKGARFPEQAADPLLVHPDVRRMLLTMRAYVQGGRALMTWVAAKSDISESHPDPDLRRDADEFVALMTPIAKAFLTDVGSEVTNLGVQIYGGHGYIHDHGMEQYVRDARIFQIYEGANGIQAMDLVGRKLPKDLGRALRHFFHPVAEFLEDVPDQDELKPLYKQVQKSFARLQTATTYVATRGLADPDEAATAASEYLRLFGLVALGYLWLRMAVVAARGEGSDAPGLRKAKVSTARFYCTRLLPQTGALLSSICAGASSTMEFDDAEF